jgi:LacI family transcriptional regulator
MPPTIKDVAQLAKVSTATVSLVIHENDRISTPTRRRVQQAINDLDYQPSKNARGLVMRQTHNIGFILTDDHFLKTEPFYTYVFLGTEFEARGHNYYILLNTIPSVFHTDDCLPRFVKEKNVDGIIIAGKVPYEIISCLEPYNLPLVFVDYYPSNGEYYSVLIDNIEGGKRATEYLMSLGHHRIAFLGGDLEHPSIRDRLHGYQLAHENKKLPIDRKIIITSETMTSREAGTHAAASLLAKKKNFSAVFACNDAMALGAIQHFKTKGLRIPEDISVIGFDDVQTVSASDSPLTTIRVPKIEMGTQTMKMMVDLLDKRIKKSHKVLIPVELVIRTSTKKI